jgi:hypothetical protein
MTAIVANNRGRLPAIFSRDAEIQRIVGLDLSIPDYPVTMLHISSQIWKQGEFDMLDARIVEQHRRMTSADGLEDRRTIVRRRLNSALACNTAGDNGRLDAGGLSGLAPAFFYAGSRALLVSHWVRKSDAAVTLTMGTFAQLERNRSLGRAEAFRRWDGGAQFSQGMSRSLLK